MRIFDAIDAHVIVPLQMQLTFPKIGIEHAIVADLDDVDAAPKAFVSGDFSARKAIARRLGHGASTCIDPIVGIKTALLSKL